MAYVKLDTGILNSTLWIERECREIFITALLMAEPRDYAKPLKQIAVRTLDYTGWEAPPRLVRICAGGGHRHHCPLRLGPRGRAGCA